jgi:hypothetical protein
VALVYNSKADNRSYLDARYLASGKSVETIRQKEHDLLELL